MPGREMPQPGEDPGGEYSRERVWPNDSGSTAESPWWAAPTGEWMGGASGNWADLLRSGLKKMAKSMTVVFNPDCPVELSGKL